MLWPTLAKRPLLLPKGNWCRSCLCSPTPPTPASWPGPPWISPGARDHQCQHQLCSLNPRHHLPENPAPSSLKRKAGEYEWAVCMLGEGHAHRLRAAQISGGTAETTRDKREGTPTAQTLTEPGSALASVKDTEMNIKNHLSWDWHLHTTTHKIAGGILLQSTRVSARCSAMTERLGVGGRSKEGICVYL